MLKIFTQTPIYVWPLLIYLIFVGLKASKTNIISLRKVLIVPIAFTLWSSYTIFSRYEMNFLMFIEWIFSTALGIVIGFLMIRGLEMRFDKQKKLVEFSGSWMLLLLVMSIFSVRFFLGAVYSFHPEFIAKGIFFPLELIATVVSGCLIGRSAGCLKKYKDSTHENLA